MPAANIPPMVATSSPSALEVNLRRLMAKCDAKVRSSDKILQGSDRTRYATNIKVLKEMLMDLEDELTKNGKGDIDALMEYEKKIEQLASVVDGSAPIVSGNKGLVQVRMIPPVSQTPDALARGINSAPRRISQHVLEPSREDLHGQSSRSSKEPDFSTPNRADELLGLRERRSGKDTSQQRQTDGLRISDARDPAPDQRQIEAALQNDRTQREEMEEGISRLMQQLRHNAMAIQQTLTDEQKSGILDDADQALDNNISRLGKERTRLELYSKQSRKTKWMIWGIVLGVSVMFVFMFFVIRIF
ncbi:vesicle transport protein [Gamsiella multidivaricata]|uniref:vesicle transport protein n=1 Tax=Gamsiella multidivaricata TaxID=101098 RepID=UPI00222009B4|nr:vesicle transport protein [Gamsiella multidivaricata]KAI7824651.1 vesicle transport protein [Gamsiella multidivaricata]